jgi:hypothetical protein
MLGNASNPSPGQIAYERDVEQRPFYDDGTARPTWYDLGAIARWSWERNPTPRALYPRPARVEVAEALALEHREFEGRDAPDDGFDWLG